MEALGEAVCSDIVLTTDQNEAGENGVRYISLMKYWKRWRNRQTLDVAYTLPALARYVLSLVPCTCANSHRLAAHGPWRWKKI